MKRLVRRSLRRAAERLAPPEVLSALRFLRTPRNPIFPRRPVTVAGSVPAGGVLVLAPHPDDEAIGTGAVLALHRAAGAEVTVLYLTDGGGSEQSGASAAERDRLVALRRREAEAAGAELGLAQVFWTQRDTRLASTPETVEELARLLTELRPREVYVPSLFDTHYDHFATTCILADALAQVPPAELYVSGYEVWDPIAFPNWIVDVSTAFEQKERMLACYETPHRYTDFTDLCRKRAALHYTLHVSSERERARTGRAEAFLRLDGDAYCRLHRSWTEALRQNGSDLVAHARSLSAESARAG